MAFVSNFFEPVLLHHFGLVSSASDFHSKGMGDGINNIVIEIRAFLPVEENIRESNFTEIPARVARLSFRGVGNAMGGLIAASSAIHRESLIADKYRTHNHFVSRGITASPGEAEAQHSPRLGDQDAA